MSFCPINTKGVPDLKKLCIFQFATNDENEFGGVFTKSSKNIAYPNLIAVKWQFRIQGITRVHKSTNGVKLCVGVGHGVGGGHEGPIWPTD